jgi:hypothetical protein
MSVSFAVKHLDCHELHGASLVTNSTQYAGQLSRSVDVNSVFLFASHLPMLKVTPVTCGNIRQSLQKRSDRLVPIEKPST